ncbi:serine protease SP24D-like [Musca autumnalis]|uniref:serine protease SP24D-like n=1 Tax=Musca autumnalis TaxID=221902 RepID=UPI003CE684E3
MFDITAVFKTSLFALMISLQGAEASKGNSLYPQSRILGGATASEGQFPHQVSLRWGGVHVCGGSIISPTYIVTAAHCLAQGQPPKAFSADYISIRAGSRQHEKGGQVIQAAELKIHPNYDKSHNDIALVKLSRPLEFNNNVQPIALAQHEPPTGVPIIKSGWGLTKKGGSTPKYLQYNTFVARRHADCGRVTDESVLCLAHSLGQGICMGDSGGPAIYKNELVGVSNYVVDGCGSRYADGVASVAYQYNWLISNSRN